MGGEPNEEGRPGEDPRPLDPPNGDPCCRRRLRPQRRRALRQLWWSGGRRIRRLDCALADGAPILGGVNAQEVRSSPLPREADRVSPGGDPKSGERTALRFLSLSLSLSFVEVRRLARTPSPRVDSRCPHNHKLGTPSPLLRNASRGAHQCSSEPRAPTRCPEGQGGSLPRHRAVTPRSADRARCKGRPPGPLPMSSALAAATTGGATPFVNGGASDGAAWSALPGARRPPLTAMRDAMPPPLRAMVA